MADPVEQVIDQMVANGEPPEKIREFVGWAANEARAKRLADAETTYASETRPGAIAAGVVGDIKARLVQMARSAATGAKTIAPEMVKPFGLVRMFTDPAKRRQIGRGASDVLTMGRGAQAMDALLEAAPGLATDNDPSGLPVTFAGSEAADQAAAPGYREVGQGMGAVNPMSPWAKLGGGAMGLAAKAGAGRTGQAIFGSGVAGGVAGAVAGGPEGAVQGATDPLGLLIPAAAGTANALMRRNPSIGRYARSKEAGIYADPEMPSEKGARGVQRAREVGQRRVASREAQLDQRAASEHAAGTRPHLSKPVNAEKLQMRLLEQREAGVAPDSRRPANPSVFEAFDEAIDAVPDNANVQGTLMRRRALADQADYGNPSPSKEQLAKRQVYQAMRQAVREASPEVAAADDAYSQYARQADRRRDILYRTQDDVAIGGRELSTERPPVEAADTPVEQAPRMRVAKEQAAQSTLGRIDDVNDPGLRIAPYLREFAAMDPEFADALNFIAAKKAQEAVRPGWSGMKPTSLTGAVEFGGKGPFVRQNLRALGAHVVEPVSRTAISPGGLNLNILAQMSRAEQEKNRRLAETLKAGGRR